VVSMVVDAAERESLRLTPPELATSPEVFRRADGSTVFRPRHCVVFTSHELLAAEDRLLARSEDRTAPAIGREVIERVARKEHLLSAEQVETLAQISVSGRQQVSCPEQNLVGAAFEMNGHYRTWRRFTTVATLPRQLRSGVQHQASAPTTVQVCAGMQGLLVDTSMRLRRALVPPFLLMNDVHPMSQPACRRPHEDRLVGRLAASRPWLS
jgi:hypothetical protein